MTSRSTSLAEDGKKLFSVDGQPRESPDSPNLRGLPDAPLECKKPFRSGSNFEPIELPRRTTTKSAVDQTRRFFHRFRRQPIDPSLERVSNDAEEHPRPRGGPAQCDFGEILKKVLPRTDFKITYPEFDAAGSYVQSEAVLLKLWHDETGRLMDIAKRPDKPLEFSSDGFFQGDTEKGYRDMSKLCQKILTAITICLLDNECINAEHCGQLANRQRLSSLIKQADKGQDASESIASNEDPEAQRLAYASLAATYNLINYISAVLTRLIVQTSPGTYWQTNVLSVLIKRITKIKLLLVDLQASSAIAVRSAEAILSNLRESGDMQHRGSEMDVEEECEEYLRMVEANEKQGTASFEEKQIAAHCVEQNKFRHGLNSALKEILMSMRFINRSGLPATAFEICAVAYETGFEGFKALLYQDRDLEYSATSDLDNMNTAHSAFNIFNQTVMHLNNTSREKKKHQHLNSLETTLEWAYSGSENNQSGAVNIDLAGRNKSMQLNSMDEVITIMVALATTSPNFLAGFTNFRHVMALTGFIQDDVQPLEEGQFNAFFRMYTGQFNDNVDRRDVLHLSEALGSGFFSRSSLVRSSGFGPKAQQNATHQLNELTKYMDEWVVDEMSVMLPCPVYVWSVVSIAALIAGGGLGIGFSVGDRIHGVDPSNLATYLWVVAAFIVLIAKSMHVKEWTWNDFLRRRVRCSSVSELQSISRIDGQLIIAKLLHDERRGSVLKIRGPYNSVFLKRSTEGFSIDKPISSSTLLLSGLTMLKVVTAKGHALVCLDFRRGTDLRIIAHTPDPQEEHLICERIDRVQFGTNMVDAKSPPKARHTFTRSKALKWKRVQGIYKLMDAQFV